MILGSGDIAKQIKDREGMTFFAKGVSNSACTDNAEYHREWMEVKALPIDCHLVYFSSLSIYYSDSLYAKQKIRMENYIRYNFMKYCIVRLGNITWGNNPHTLINHFRLKIKSGKPYEVKDTYRYLCTPEVFDHWISMIPDFKNEMNIPGELVSVKEIERRIINGEL